MSPFPLSNKGNTNIGPPTRAINPKTNLNEKIANNNSPKPQQIFRLWSLKSKKIGPNSNANEPKRYKDFIYLKKNFFFGNSFVKFFNRLNIIEFLFLLKSFVHRSFE